MLGIIRRILKISGKYKGKLIFSFVMSFLESLMFALSVFFVFVALRWIITGNLLPRQILILAVVLVVSLILRFFFKLLEYIFQSGVGYEIVCDERLKLGKKLLNLSMGFYSDTDAGDISSVINNDLVFVENLAMNYVSKIIGAMASAVLITAFLFILDWRIALVACIGYPLAWLANRFIQRTFVKYSKKRQAAHAETSSLMLEYLQGTYVIKAFRLAGCQKERLEDVLKRLEIVSFDFEMKGLPWIGMYLISFHIGTTAILAAIAYFLLGASMPLGTALIFVVMLFSFYAPAELIGLTSGFIRLMNACLDRMQAIMGYPVMDTEGSAKAPKQYHVSFQNVDFSYGDKPVLRDVSFDAPQHTMTAIIGPSGSGKSTLLNLIARFWDVSSGSVRIGGVDIKTMKCEKIMENISAVFQKAYLFHDTIYNNILFGNPQATKEQVIGAATKAHCHEFISCLENGYDTMVGEGGFTLSGGERQRVSIARALLKNAPIILLDEVTANIDPENEKLIQQAIGELVKDKTVFVVAHKLASIRNAYQIIVLNSEGMIAESGTHDELIGQNGLYTKLWNKSQKISSWMLDAGP
jgi:ATP-binding cassette subfamily B protein